MKPEDSRTKTVVEAEQQRCKALVEVDLTTLDELFDDELMHVHSTGMVHGKRELLEYIAARHAFIRCERGDLRVKLYADIAVLTGTIRNIMRAPGAAEPIQMDGIAVQVLRYDAENARWRFIHFQFTRTPAA